MSGVDGEEKRKVPTPAEWAGGLPAFERLFAEFYGRVPNDPLLAPVFAGMSADHVRHVSRFVTEVMGGPAASVAWLANKLAEFGHKLDKGAKILTGSFTKQFPVAQGDVVEARFTPYDSVTAEFV